MVYVNIKRLGCADSSPRQAEGFSRRGFIAELFEDSLKLPEYKERTAKNEREFVMQENTQKEENGQSLDIIDYTVLTSFLVVALYYATDMARYLAVPHHTLAMYFGFW